MHMQHNQVAEYKLHNLYKEERLSLSILDKCVCRVFLKATKIIFYSVSFGIYFINSQKFEDQTNWQIK